MAEARDRGVEEVEEEERGVLVVVELAVGAVVMLLQVSEEPANALQAFPSDEFFEVRLCPDRRARHGSEVYACARMRTVNFEI